MDLPQQLQRSLLSFALDLARLAVWLILLIVIFAPAEKRWALHPRRFLRKAFGADVVYYFFSGIVPKLLLVIPLSLLVRSLHHFVPSGFYASAALLPLWLRLAASLAVGDVGAYWGHRWSHEWPLLWRFHAIHHGPEEIDWLVSSHGHPIDMAFTRLCGMIPVYALGLAQPFGGRVDAVPFLLVFIGTVWGFFIHANLNWRFGRLEWLITSPGFHHWHHTNDGPERINKNYASLLPWVDKLFGTFYLPKDWPVVYGIDRPLPPGFAGQILEPLLGPGVPTAEYGGPVPRSNKEQSATGEA